MKFLILFLLSISSLLAQINLGPTNKQVRGVLPAVNGGTALSSVCSNLQSMVSNGTIYVCTDSHLFPNRIRVSDFATGETYTDGIYAGTPQFGSSFGKIFATSQTDAPNIGVLNWTRADSAAGDHTGNTSVCLANVNSGKCWGANFIVSGEANKTDIKLIGLEIDIQPVSTNTMNGQSVGLALNAYSLPIPTAIHISGTGTPVGSWTNGILIDGIASTGAGLLAAGGSVMNSLIDTTGGTFNIAAINLGNNQTLRFTPITGVAGAIWLDTSDNLNLRPGNSQLVNILDDVVVSGTITGTNVTSGANPGHTHTTTSISGLDISDDTNLAVTAPVVLTGDTLSFNQGANFTWTGIHTFTDTIINREANATGIIGLTVTNSSEDTGITKYIGIDFHGEDTVGTDKQVGIIQVDPVNNNWLDSNMNFYIMDNTVVVNTVSFGFDGGIQLKDQGTKPTCNSANRGTFYYDAGAGGVKDTVEVCGKDAADVYAWRTIY